MHDASPARLEPDLLRLCAPNPSPMTAQGTNTYLLGTRSIAVIDPGPDDAAHLDAILDAVPAGGRISHIVVTHAHRDHSALAPALAARTGAAMLAFGTATDGRSAVMQRLADSGLAGGGEGLDHGFRPDRRLADSEEIRTDEWALTALWTPGHVGCHLCLAWGDIVFTGDHVMGWASSLVSPPDGDLTDFMASCRRLAARPARRFLPGHGDPVEDPAGRLAWLIAHRESREAQILAGLEDGLATVPALTAALYQDTPAALLPAAARNVFAHLVDLWSRGAVRADPGIGPDARFERR